VLTLEGDRRHELSCSACGAPLRDLKMLRTDKKADKKAGKRDAGRTPTRGAPSRSGPPAVVKVAAKQAQSKRGRRRGLMARMLDEALDVVEDIFD